MNFRFTSHRKEVMEALEEAKERALEMIGAKAAGYVAALAPHDTGRLRNSITWATKRSEGRAYAYTDDENRAFAYNIGTGVPKDSVCVGTNVEYAIYQELGTRLTDAHPYLRPGIMNHLDEYKQITEQELKS